jgi:hypothetical protein
MFSAAIFCSNKIDGLIKVPLPRISSFAVIATVTAGLLKGPREGSTAAGSTGNYSIGIDIVIEIEEKKISNC